MHMLLAHWEELRQRWSVQVPLDWLEHPDRGFAILMGWDIKGRYRCCYSIIVNPQRVEFP